MVHNQGVQIAMCLKKSPCGLTEHRVVSQAGQSKAANAWSQQSGKHGYGILMACCCCEFY